MGHKGDYNVRSIGQKVRVFIGTEPRTEIARKVLELSIRRRTDAEVEFTPMIGPAWEYPTDEITVGTGFSLRRWMVAAECRFKGRAIYLDADQLCQADIWDLWTMPDQRPKAGASVWCTNQVEDRRALTLCAQPQSSVMVIDCEAAREEWGWRIGEVLRHLRGKSQADYHAFMRFQTVTTDNRREFWTKVPPVEIPAGWNYLDRAVQGSTKLIHYTKASTQPWINPDHEHGLPWRLEFQVALSTGYLTLAEVRAEVARFGVPPADGYAAAGPAGLHPYYDGFVDGKRHTKKTRNANRSAP